MSQIPMFPADKANFIPRNPKAPRYQLCDSRYEHGKGCNGCPIHTVCTGGHQWGREGLKEWQKQCDEVALKHLEES
jgi:hypothetical protein